MAEASTSSNKRNAEDPPEESPCSKRLRCSDPDLKVILKYADEEGNPAEKIYPMYRHNLARLSKFIDDALSVDMREKATGEMLFQMWILNCLKKPLISCRTPLPVDRLGHKMPWMS